MDIFDILTAIIEKKTAFMHNGMNEHKAMEKAKLDISREYHIPLLDINKLTLRSKIHRDQQVLMLYHRCWKPAIMGSKNLDKNSEQTYKSIKNPHLNAWD